MSHLILPIDIEGTKYCVKHGATTPKWRTVSILDDSMQLVASEDQDAWEIPDIYDNPVGQIFYSTCCIWKATIRFFIESSNEFKAGSITINEIEIFSFDLSTSAGEIIDYEVDLNALGLIDRACGNLWIIRAVCEDQGSIGMRIEVVDVTFGPPV